jgi:hypothetical protein
LIKYKIAGEFKLITKLDTEVNDLKVSNDKLKEKLADEESKDHDLKM